MRPKAEAGAPEAKLWRVLALPALLDSGNLAALGSTANLPHPPVLCVTFNGRPPCASPCIQCQHEGKALLCLGPTEQGPRGCKVWLTPKSCCLMSVGQSFYRGIWRQDFENLRAWGQET